MLERLKKKRMSRELRRKSQKSLKKSRSTSPRPKQKLKESTNIRNKTPTSRFEDKPTGDIFKDNEKLIASPFNEEQHVESVILNI